MNEVIDNQLSPDNILQIGLGFWASKVLITAASMELFTHLAQGALTGAQIKEKLGLHKRALYDFLDALVALGFLQRDGLKEAGIYSNAADTDLFLDKNKSTYVGGMLEMSNSRLYQFWGGLEEGLKTGLPQNEAKGGGKRLFEELYADEARLREFIRAMASVQMGNFMMFAQTFDFSNYKTLCDVGGAGAHLSAMVAMHNAHINCISFDLRLVMPVAQDNIAQMKVADQVTCVAGDFFNDAIPQADVITMGNILHDWGLEEKKVLIKKAYNALPEGGALVVIENIIDDERNQNVFGLLMSLNMLIATPDGFDYTSADLKNWVTEAGFKSMSLMPLIGATSVAIAIK